MANEKRLIDANALLADLKEELEFETQMFTAEQNEWIDYGLRVAIKDVKYQPTVDAVEVVHGRFELIEKAGVDYWSCSACKEIVDEYYHKPKYKYCPNCGAKMDGDGNG